MTTKLLQKLIENIKKEFFYILSTRKQRKILFDHLPKCGGTSVTSYFVSNYPDRKIYSTHKGGVYSDFIEKFKEMPLNKRYDYDLVIGHNSRMLLSFIHPESIKATLLRDPVDRIISHYYYANKKKSLPAPKNKRWKYGS